MGVKEKIRQGLPVTAEEKKQLETRTYVVRKLDGHIVGESINGVLSETAQEVYELIEITMSYNADRYVANHGNIKYDYSLQKPVYKINNADILEEIAIPDDEFELVVKEDETFESSLEMQRQIHNYAFKLHPQWGALTEDEFETMFQAMRQYYIPVAEQLIQTEGVKKILWSFRYARIDDLIISLKALPAESVQVLLDTELLDDDDKVVVQKLMEFNG